MHLSARSNCKNIRVETAGYEEGLLCAVEINLRQTARTLLEGWRPRRHKLGRELNRLAVETTALHVSAQLR